MQSAMMADLGTALNVMALGMLGIFIVTGVIIGVITVLSRLPEKSRE